MTNEIIADPEIQTKINVLQSQLATLAANQPELLNSINDNSQKYGDNAKIDDEPIYADDFIHNDPLIRLLFGEHNKTLYEANNSNSDIRKSGLISISNDGGHEKLTLPSLHDPEYKKFLLDQVELILTNSPDLELKRRKNHPEIFLAQQLAIFWRKKMSREYKRNKSSAEPSTEMEIFISTAAAIMAENDAAKFALNYVRRHTYKKLEEDARQ